MQGLDIKQRCSQTRKGGEIFEPISPSCAIKDSAERPSGHNEPLIRFGLKAQEGASGEDENGGKLEGPIK